MEDLPPARVSRLGRRGLFFFTLWLLLGLFLAFLVLYSQASPVIPAMVRGGWGRYLGVEEASPHLFLLACLGNAPCYNALFRSVPLGEDLYYYALALWGVLGAVLFLRPKKVEIPMRYGQHFATEKEIAPLVEKRTGEELVDSAIPGSKTYKEGGLTGYLGVWMGEGLEKKKPDGNKKLFLRLPQKIERIHTITYAGTGGGKTVGIFRPRIALDAAEGNIAIVFDTKYPSPGDSYTDVRDWFRAYGRKVWVIDPFGFERGEEAVQLAVLEGIETFADALDAARLIYPPDIEEADAASRVFVANARSLLAGIIFALAKSPVEKLSFKRIAYWANQSTPALVANFNNYHEAKAAIQSTLGADKYVLSGAQNRLVTDLEIFQMDSADWLFSKGPKAVDPEVMLSEPGMVHLVFPERYIRGSAGRAILRFFKRYFDGVVLRMVEKLGGPLPYHVNYYYDELALFGFLPDLDSDLATLRSRNISVHMATQSRAQMEKIYGEKGWQAAENNNIGTFYLVPGSYTPQEAQYWSKMLGKYSLLSLSLSESENRLHKSTGMTVGERERELITPDEMLTMGVGEMIVLVRGFNPILVKTYPVESKESPVNWVMERVEEYRRERREKLLATASATPPIPAHQRPAKTMGEVYQAFESFVFALGAQNPTLHPLPGGNLALPEDLVKATGTLPEVLESLVRARFLERTKWGLCIPKRNPYGKRALFRLLEQAGVRFLHDFSSDSEGPRKSGEEEGDTSVVVGEER